MNINISNSTLNNSPTIAGNNDSIITTGRSNSQPVLWDWELLKRDLVSAIDRLPDESKEYIAANAILYTVEKKDKDQFCKSIKKFSSSFLSSLFSSVASNFLIEFIKSII